ncbi:hypothetical protein MJD09_25495 [bacterium]|nr:hypothetical protein [bacterium]
MKNLKSLLLAATVAGITLAPSLSEAGIRVYLRVGPPKVKTVTVVKPAKPYRNAVWVNAHYRYINGRYVWTKGRYIKSRPGYKYIQPRWVKMRSGYYFVEGHWVIK